MRYHFSLFVVFSVGALVLTAPTDTKPTTSDGVNEEDVKPGHIYWPRVRHLEPKDPDLKTKYGGWRHPVIVVSDVDADDKVKVAPVTHHTGHRGPVEPASNYADLRGTINVGPPKTVHIAHLGRQSRGTGVLTVGPGRLQPLIDRINANCPADKQLAGCEPSGSAQDNTAPGRSEDDPSKQGSPKSSSNKGSSSQGSRPGSPKQSSQESSPSQGSQLGSSKQGSPPGSSGDGWRVVTGRRRNKARGSGTK